MNPTRPGRPFRLASVPVLSVSPNPYDHAVLCRILVSADDPIVAALTWSVHRASSLESARISLGTIDLQIVVSERDIPPATWKDLLADISAMRDPPLLIVTSRLADENLWAEALNLGAWDVLAKPFDSDEVLRVLSSASSRRTEQLRLHGKRFPGSSPAARTSANAGK